MNDIFESLNHIADGRILATKEELLKAFVDAGYVYIEPRDLATNTWLSGQEWYDKFEKEFESTNIVGFELFRQNALEVAKRAAGLEE